MRYLFFSLLLCISSLSHAKPYIIGVENIDYLPYYQTDTDNHVHGHTIHILSAFFKNVLDKNVVFKPLPVNRLYTDLMQGQIDFKYPDNPKWNNPLKDQAKVLYSGPVAKYVDGIMVEISQSGQDISNISHIATIRGFHPWILQDRIQAEQIKLVEVDDMNSLFKLLRSNRVGGVFINTIVANRFLAEKGDNMFVFDKTLPFIEGAYHMSTLNHPDVIEKLNHWLTTSPAVNTINEKWGIPD